MRISTFATLFSGAGGADCGLSGLKHLWGIENNPKAAAIAQLNGFSPVVCDIKKAQWAKLKRPDWLHASPPCQNASVANIKQDESKLDIDLAQSVRSALAYFKPTYFSLENVAGYRKFRSFDLITYYLLRNGYSVCQRVLDSADYGVAQNRKRLWLVASKAAYPRLPWSTHGDNWAQRELFGDLLPRVSWDEAIANAGPLFKDGWSTRMQKAFSGQVCPPGRYLVTGFKSAGSKTFDRPLTIRKEGQVSSTLTATMNRPSTMPWIVSIGKTVKSERLDVPHMAALQSFPANYVWGSDVAAARKAIGNAVSPKIMKAIVLANLGR